MLYEDVERLVAKYEQRKEHIRLELLKGATSTILSSAETGSKKSFMFVTDEQLSEFTWLKGELRREGITTSVVGSTFHFNVTGPSARARRSLHKNDSDEYAY